MAYRLIRIVVAIVLLLVAVAGGAVAWVTLLPDTLKPPLQRFLSAELGHAVELQGPLRIGLGLVTTVEVERVRIAAPEWARQADLATLDRLRVGIDIGAYVRNRLIRITELVIDAPRLALERDAQGRTSWPSAKREATARQGGGSFPQLDALTITGGHVAYLDAVSAVDVAADVTTTKPGAGSFGLSIDGGGAIRTDPVQLTLQVQPTAPISQPNIPLEITGALQAAGSRLQLIGHLREPATMTGLALDLDVASDDPRPLLAMAGRPVAEPLPPLKVAAHLSRESGVLELQIAQGSWGKSSLDGHLRLDMTAARPSLAGEIHAPLLDLVSLSPVMTSGDAAPAESNASRSNPLAILSGYDGELRLIFDEIDLPPRLVVKDSEAVFKLADGRLTVAPLRVGLPEGRIDGELATGLLSASRLTVDVRLQATGAGIAGIAGDGFGGQVDGTLAGTLLVGPIQVMLAGSYLRFEGQGRGVQSPVADLGSFEATAVLENGHLRLEPFHATLPQGEIAGRVAAGPFDQSFAADLDLEAKGVDLAAAARIEGVAGRLNGHLSGTLHGANGEELLTRSRLALKGTIAELKLPQLERRLTRTTLDVTLDPGRSEALQVHATASAGDRPLELKAFGGSVGTIAKNRGDYPFTVEAQLGNNNINVNGTITLPLAERRFTAKLRVEGPDPSPILALFELPKLQIPPYRVSGTLSNQGDGLRVKNFDGRVGDSDVAADLTMNFAGDRPKIAGEIHSKKLDADDLGGLVGGQPGTGPGETASPGQRAEAAGKAGKNEVLPTEPLDPSRWRKFDADLKWSADEVDAGKVPLDGFSSHVVMSNGLLHLEPLDLRIGEGHITGRIEVDGRQAPVHAEMALRMQRLSVARLLNRLDVDVAAFGTLSGQARGGVGLGGRGLSIKDILANSDGDVLLMMEGGQINRTIVAGLGLDLLRLFGSFIGATPENVPLNCTLANLEVRDGIVTTRPLIIDTEIARLGGEGTVDLKSEAVDISLTAEPKKTPLLTNLTGISITGTLAKPQLNVNPLALAARGAAAATLGVLLKPFTTMADAIDPKAPATCADLLQQAGPPAVGGGNG
jgi:uncharacterized protein involved in outer membrane biogenesis